MDIDRVSPSISDILGGVVNSRFPSKLELTVDRGLLSDRIYDLLRSMIIDGKLAPGEPVVESQMARTLGVSQAPVREALKALAHDGLITQVRHQGSFVAEFSQQESDHGRIARAALESMAAQLLHQRLTHDVKTQLMQALDGMRAAAAPRDVARFRECDFDFHRTVVVASGNVYLPRMWDVIEPTLRANHVIASHTFSGDWSEAAEMHTELIVALETGTATKAAELFTAHALGAGGVEPPPTNEQLYQIMIESNFST